MVVNSTDERNATLAEPTLETMPRTSESMTNTGRHSITSKGCGQHLHTHVAYLQESSCVRMCYIRDQLLGTKGRKFRNVRASYWSAYECMYAHKMLPDFCNIPHFV